MALRKGRFLQMAENRSISREEHRRNRAYKDKLPPFRSDMSEEDLKKWFSRARATGMFGKRYRTLDQLKRAIKYLSEGGFKPAEIRRLLQFQSTNPVIVTKKDKGATLNNRAIRQTIEADIRNDIDAIYGAGSADQLEAGLRRDWSKVRKEASAIDKLTGQISDMGHFDEGQLSDPEVQALENRILNQRAGAAGDRPNRYSLPTIREISTGGTGNTRIDKGETVWNRFALSAGAPRRSGLSTVFPGDVAKLADFGYISEDELPVLARSLEELESQGYNRAAMISHIKEVGTTNPKSLAAAGSAMAGPRQRIMPRVGKGLGLLGVGAAALGAASPAEAALNVAEAATGADQLYGTNQRNVQMVMVNGKPRPFDPDTNTLVDDPTKGLQKKNGKWVEVTRGQGVASRRQQQQIRSTGSQAVRTVQQAAETVNPATSLINNLLMPSVNRFSQIINNIIRPDT